MPTTSSNEPKVVSYNIPTIEVYQVTDDELRRIEEGTSNVGNEFATMLTAISITVSLGIALIQGQFEADTEIVFQAAVVVTGVTSVYMDIRWFRHRSTVSRLVSDIRSRRTEPDT